MKSDPHFGERRTNFQSFSQCPNPCRVGVSSSLFSPSLIGLNLGVMSVIFSQANRPTGYTLHNLPEHSTTPPRRGRHFQTLPQMSTRRYNERSPTTQCPCLAGGGHVFHPPPVGGKLERKMVNAVRIGRGSFSRSTHARSFACMIRNDSQNGPHRSVVRRWSAGRVCEREH